ncbi:MAG: ATP-binding protein [Acidobacteria bacterium]|jgi:serine/threonine-protein kinase RsbW|nr:ATP-binding protein [Acidobacteriota bacterium]
MKKKLNKITLDFVSDLKFTEFCVLVASYIKNMNNIKEDEFFKIEISLREVLNNAIIHGNKTDKNKRICVTFWWTHDQFSMSIKDENPEKIDFNSINNKLLGNDLLSYNGRGILIMKSYMDKVEFHPSENGTEVILEKEL